MSTAHHALCDLAHEAIICLQRLAHQQMQERKRSLARQPSTGFNGSMKKAANEKKRRKRKKKEDKQPFNEGQRDR